MSNNSFLALHPVTTAKRSLDSDGKYFRKLVPSSVGHFAVGVAQVSVSPSEMILHLLHQPSLFGPHVNDFSLKTCSIVKNIFFL